MKKINRVLIANRGEIVVSGVDTTIPLYHLVLNHPDFIDGKINTRWLEDIIVSHMRRER